MINVKLFSSSVVRFLCLTSGLKRTDSLFAEGCYKSTTLVHMNTFDAAFAVAASIWFVLVVLCVGDQTEIADSVVVLVSINVVYMQVRW